MKKYFEKRNKFCCPVCGCNFTYRSIWAWLSRPHFFDIWRYNKCPECGVSNWMKRIKVE